MNVAEFIAKWRRADLTERSAAQQHFLDLCELLDHPKPAEADPTGEWFTFERGAAKHGGGDGWADVWKRGFFGWEYKKKDRDLEKAYNQLCLYMEALENPPLLVVCDTGRTVVHTRFSGAPSVVHEIALEELADPDKLAVLRAVFHDPEKLKPEKVSEAITEDAARRLAAIAQALRERGLDPHDVARFLDRIVFCLFAEDVDLLPKGLFSEVVAESKGDPELFSRFIVQLFDVMANGGYFGVKRIRHFNGSLFESGPVLELTEDEVAAVHEAARLDWGEVDASIFGTLFERGMDPSKRGQLGAHYTSREDIETLVDPVVMQPLRRQWQEILQVVDNLLTFGKKQPTGKEKKAPSKAVLAKARKQAAAILQDFLFKLSRVKVLDPACGSGNFLYVTLQRLKDLEKQVILFANANGLGPFLPMVMPTQLYAIEINPYAHELAQMTVWIGYLQWTRANGFGWPQDPVLRPMNNFQCKDAILDLTDPDNPREPEWPKVDFIVGNPPFLGNKFLRRELGDEYVDRLFALWKGRVSNGVDLCCYWFDKARGQVEQGKCRRAGLLATQGIRGGANREVLQRIKESGDIFFAESDRPWVLDGANVHVSMVGFDNADETARFLDGNPVTRVNANLTSTAADTTTACRLAETQGLALIGSTKKAPLDVPFDFAMQLLRASNPHGMPNSDVVLPYLNALDVTRRRRDFFIIDFPMAMPMEQACRFEEAFEYAKREVLPLRRDHREAVQRNFWWRQARPCPEIRSRVHELERFCATPGVSKHRVFVWLETPVMPDHQLYVFARSDDYFFGVLHSRIHELWALRLGTRLETRPRYTPTTCFETFPFPWPPGEEPTDDPRVKAIAEAARELDALRNQWLNPPEWTREEVLEFPGSADGPWKRYVHDPDANGVGVVRYPRLAPRDEDCAKRLKKRTLTNLYNERPTWLDLAHKKLDEAVFAAYAWPPDLTDEQLLEKLLALNLERGRE